MTVESNQIQLILPRVTERRIRISVFQWFLRRSKCNN
jgi:hypothetical protein